MHSKYIFKILTIECANNVKYFLPALKVTTFTASNWKQHYKIQGPTIYIENCKTYEKIVKGFYFYILLT